MKRTKILAILVVGVMSVSLLATVEKPDDTPKGKGWDQVWDALVDLQGQIVQEIAGRIAGDYTLQSNIDAEATARTDGDAQLQSNIKEETADRIAADGALKAQIEAIPALPAGVIVMWSGEISDIPEGWALCDGSDGTPDLRDKFIYGVSEGEEPGAEGGSATHSHPYSDVPSHTHGITDPGHNHSFQRFFSFGSVYAMVHGDGACQEYSDTQISTTGITVDAAGVASPVTDLASSLPPYYKLAFIMKLPDE